MKDNISGFCFSFFQMIKYSRYYFTLFIYFFFITINSQKSKDILISACVKSADGGNAIAFATIASFKNVTLYSANEDGCFNLPFPKGDSIRVAAIGYYPKIVVLDTIDSDKSIIIPLESLSYQLPEVVIRKNPLKVEMHLPTNFGSEVSNLPPNERPDYSGTSPLNPVSFLVKKIGRKKDPGTELMKVREREALIDHRRSIAGREVIKEVSGLEGSKLDEFIIYCNIKLEITYADNYSSAISKIKELLEEFLQKEK